MLSRFIAKNIGDVYWDTVYTVYKANLSNFRSLGPPPSKLQLREFVMSLECDITLYILQYTERSLYSP